MTLSWVRSSGKIGYVGCLKLGLVKVWGSTVRRLNSQGYVHDSDARSGEQQGKASELILMSLS